MNLINRFSGLVHYIAGDSLLEMCFGKSCMGFAAPGKPGNCIAVYPQENYLVIAFETPESDDISARLDAQGFGTATYDVRSHAYWIYLTDENITGCQEVLRYLIRRMADVMKSRPL
jgi:hypothetical protein